MTEPTNGLLPPDEAGKFDELVAATIRTAVDDWRVHNDPADPHGVSMPEYIRRALADAGLLASRSGAAEVEAQGLSHALLLKGYRGFADQVTAMGQRIREQDEELALHREREALTRNALRLDDKWVVQLGALAVRQERDRLRKQLGLTSDSWKPGDIVLDCTNFAWRRFETGWRTVPRDRGVQYEDEQLESLAGPLMRLASIPAEVDELGSVPADVAARLRAEANRA